MSKCPACGGRIKRKMRPGGGKAKGSSFERDACKGISLWLSDGKRDDLLWRSAISGGRATVAKRKGENLGHVSGDVCAVHELGFPFVKDWYIECKSLKNLTLTQLVATNDGLLVDYWNVARDWAKTYDKYPCLIAKQNGYEPIMLLNREGAEALRLLDKQDELARIPRLDIYIYLFTDMLDARLPWRTRS